MTHGIQFQPQRGLQLDKRTVLFDQLLASIDQRICKESQDIPGSVGAWAENVPIILDGRSFTFFKHEFLRTPYEDDHPYQVEMKAAQIGNTTKAILRTLFYARYKNLVGILYLFPSRTDVLDFSRGRINTLISENPNTIGRWLTDTDSAGLKRIWNTIGNGQEISQKQRPGNRPGHREDAGMCRPGVNMTQEILPREPFSVHG